MKINNRLIFKWTTLGLFQSVLVTSCLLTPSSWFNKPVWWAPWLSIGVKMYVIASIPIQVGCMTISYASASSKKKLLREYCPKHTVYVFDSLPVHLFDELKSEDITHAIECYRHRPEETVFGYLPPKTTVVQIITKKGKSHV